MNPVDFGLGFLAACLFIWLIRLARRHAVAKPSILTPQSFCPVCSQPLSEDGSCAACGRPVSSFDAQDIVQRALQNLVDDRQIEPGVYEQVVSALRRADAPPFEHPRPEHPTLPATEAAQEFVLAEIVAPPESQVSKEPVPDVPEGELQLSHAVSPVEDRVRTYAERRTAAVTAADDAAPPPQRRWTELFGAFMEEKNIRWGELVGGLLILSGSVALVISFWESISEQWMLKLGVLHGVTAALFALGLHAARRWKLPTTSQGILLTAALLVPLNFLAIAAFSQTSDAFGVASLAGELVLTALLTTLVYWTACVVTPQWPALLTAGIILPSVAQLFIRRHIDESSPLIELYLFALACIVPAMVMQAVVARRLRFETTISERHANELIKHLGLMVFPAVISLGLLLAKSEDVSRVLQWLSPLSLVAATPVLTAGVLLWKRPGAEETSLRLTGTSLTVASAMMLIAGCVAAWPQPTVMIALALSAFVWLSVFAVYFRVPDAHTGAAGFLAGSLLLLCHVGLGTLDWATSSTAEVINACISAQSGRVLAGMALASICASAVLLRIGHRGAARGYALVGGAAALIGFALVFVLGFGKSGDPEHFVWIVGGYSLVTLFAARMLRNRLLMVLGGALGFATLVQFFNYGPWSLQLDDPWRITLLCHSSMMLAVAFLSKNRDVYRFGEGVDAVASVWSLVVLTVTALDVAVEIVFVGNLGESVFVARDVFWMAGILLGLAVVSKSSRLFTCVQACIALAVVLVVEERLPLYESFYSQSFGRLHPVAWQLRGIALAACGMAWIVARIAIGRQSLVGILGQQWQGTLRAWLRPAWPSPDRWLIAIALGIVLMLAVYGIVPGIAQELTPRVTSERIVPDAQAYELLGIPHAPAHGLLTWVLVGMVLLAQVMAIADEPRRAHFVVLVAVASAVPLLCASHWSSTVATASATRWLCAVFFFGGSILVWCRQPILSIWQAKGRVTPDVARGLSRFCLLLLVILSSLPLIAMTVFMSLAAVALRPPYPGQVDGLIWLCVPFLVSVATLALIRSIGDFRWQSGAVGFAVLATMPLFAMTMFVVGQALAAHPVIGPDESSVFVRMGLPTSYAVPLVVVSAALVGHSLSFRSASIAFAAGVLLNVSGTAAYLLAFRGANLMQLEPWLRLAQLNASIAALVALAWLQLLRQTKFQAVARHCHWLRAQIALALGFILLPLVLLIGHLIAHPDSLLRLHQLAGGWGWSALALVILCMLAYARETEGRLRASAGLTIVAMVLCMFVLNAQSLQTGMLTRQWLAYHTLQFCVVAMGIVAVVADRFEWPRGPSAASGVRHHAALWVVAMISLLIVLGIRSMFGDPQAPWSSTLAFAMAAALSVERGQRTFQQRYLFVAAGLLNLAVSFWWIERGYLIVTGSTVSALDFFRINVVALCVPMPLWIVFSRLPQHTSKRLLVSSAVFWLALILYSFTVGVGLFTDYISLRVQAEPWVTNLSLVTLVLASALCLWHPRSRSAVVGCYFAGFAAMATLLDRFDLDAMQMTWISTMLLSAFGLMTSYLWSRRDGLATVAVRLRIPLSSAWPPSQLWLAPLNIGIALSVIALGIWVQLTCTSQPVRLAASQAVLAQAFAVGLLARGRRHTELRCLSLSIGVVGAVAFGWSWIEPQASVMTWLYRLVVVGSAHLAMAAFYGVGFVRIVRRENEWTQAASKLVPWLMVLGTIVVSGVLIGEVSIYAIQRDVPMSFVAIVAMAAALLMAMAGSLMAAIVPGKDPFGLTEKQRTIYVYATEVLAALLFLHIRVTVPELFQGLFQKYWTLIVMGIAFAGVGLSEWFRRRDQPVLSQPLENTGAFLPLLPVIGFWVTDSSVDYTLVMMMVGILYAGLSALRRSFGFGVLAALAANGGLWYFLHRSVQISFFVHPQLWLIPAAVCVLVAAYLNRDRMSDSQMTAMRYLSVSVIYASSTADIFINGVGQAPWLPVVLAGLSLLGILGGILLRIRSFLFLGTSFLLMSMLTIIWHAAVDLQQTWLWYVTAIAAGIAIIALFAVFERKRQEVLQLMDSLKTWES